MTKKDYIALAEGLREAARLAATQGDQECRVGVSLATAEVARVLAADNGRFDRDRFLAAAGVK